MNSWFIYALLAPAVYAAVNYIDKYLLSKEFDDYKALPIYTGIMGLIGGIFFWTYGGFSLLHFVDSVIVLGTGVLTLLSLIIYYKALLDEETSTIIIFFQMFPVFTLILSYLFLDETISLRQFIGFIIVLTSSLMISLKKNDQKIAFSQSFFLILIYDFIWALSGILIKFATSVNSYVQVVSYESFGVAIGAIVVYFVLPSIKNSFHKSLKTIRTKTLGILFLNEMTFLTAKSLTFYAFTIGPAALVSVLENTQVFFGLLYGFILGTIAPAIFQEDIAKEALVKKIVLTVVLFGGILLISI